MANLKNLLVDPQGEIALDLHERIHGDDKDRPIRLKELGQRKWVRPDPKEFGTIGDALQWIVSNYLQPAPRLSVAPSSLF